MKNTTIYAALKASAEKKRNNLGVEYFEIPSCSTPSTDYWLASKLYAEKKLKPMASTGETDMLNFGMGYDEITNDDLIQDAILKFVLRYNYFVSKFNEINNSTSSEGKKVHEFNRIVSTLIPSMLIDKFRKISKKIQYTDLDSEGNKITKFGRVLSETYSAISLFSNQSNSYIETSDEVCLIDCIAESEVNILDLVESSEIITECINQLKQFPHQMLGFFAMRSNVSSNEIIFLMENGISNKDIFNYVLELYSTECSCRNIPNMFKNLYPETQLTYSGKMQIKKALDNDRSVGKKKILSYIKENYPELAKNR